MYYIKTRINSSLDTQLERVNLVKLSPTKADTSTIFHTLSANSLNYEWLFVMKHSGQRLNPLNL